MGHFSPHRPSHPPHPPSMLIIPSLARRAVSIMMLLDAIETSAVAGVVFLAVVNENPRDVAARPDIGAFAAHSCGVVLVGCFDSFSRRLLMRLDDDDAGGEGRVRWDGRIYRQAERRWGGDGTMPLLGLCWWLCALLCALLCVCWWFSQRMAAIKAYYSLCSKHINFMLSTVVGCLCSDLCPWHTGSRWAL